MSGDDAKRQLSLWTTKQSRGRGTRSSTHAGGRDRRSGDSERAVGDLLAALRSLLEAAAAEGARIALLEAGRTTEERKPSNETLLTIEDVMARLQVSRTTVYELRRSGRLRARYLGRSPRFREEDVRGLMDDEAF